jgi:hypothetical protein
MNIAAAVSFALTMTTGMIALAVAVYRNRGRTQPATNPPPPAPRTVYEHTVAALGDPQHIHFDTTWPS